MAENKDKRYKTFCNSVNLDNVNKDELFEAVCDAGLDSFVFVTEKSRVLKLLGSLEIKEKLRLTNRNKSISMWCEKKFANEIGISNFSGSVKNPFRIRYINFKRANKSLTNTMIVIENSVMLNNLCKERKKKYGTYVMVVFAGLYQPSREVKPATYKVLREFLKRFNVWSYDVAVDVMSDEKINNSGKDKFSKALGDICDDKKVYCHKTTIYANSCKGDIEKVLIYDKFTKETTYHKQRLDQALTGWRRIEMRVSARKRFSKIRPDEIMAYKEILDDVAREYNWQILWGVDSKTLDMQIAFLKDGRRKIKCGVKLDKWVA